MSKEQMVTGTLEERIEAAGLVLPEVHASMKGVRFPFQWVRVQGKRAFVSGHVPLASDGSLCGPFGQVGKEVSVEEACEAAKIATLAILSSLHRELGGLERIGAWLKIVGFVNSAPDFKEHPKVINGSSDLIIALFGPNVGAHSRSAVGVASLPFGNVIEIEAELELN